jgi:hypothetical protein
MSGISPAAAAISVKKLVLELEVGSASFVTLRVKPDRRKLTLDPPVLPERRTAFQPYARKPVSQ